MDFLWPPFDRVSGSMWKLCLLSKLIPVAISGGLVSPRRSRNSFSNIIKCVWISTRAKRSPMHLRGPAPNGHKASSPLARPGLAVARSKVIPKRQGNALHDQSFSWIVQPIPTKDVLTIFRSADDIDDASIDSRAKEVPVTLKVPFHRMEKIFPRAEMLGRPK